MYFGDSPSIFDNSDINPTPHWCANETLLNVDAISCDSHQTFDDINHSYEYEEQSTLESLSNESSQYTSNPLTYNCNNNLYNSKNNSIEDVPFQLYKSSVGIPIHSNELPDSDEYIPERSNSRFSTHEGVKSNKRITMRSRGHNITKEVRFRIGQLMIGYKNRYPHKTKKDIALLISKRLKIEYPNLQIDIDIKGVLYNKKQNKWEKIPPDYQLDF